MFIVGGHPWRVRYYPEGDKESSNDCISIFLFLDVTSAVAEVKARYDIILLDYDTGKPEPDFTTVNQSQIATFTCNKYNLLFVNYPRGRGFTRFIERKTLEQPTYIKNDSFRIRCDITVFKEFTTKDASLMRSDDVIVPPSDIGHHLGRLLSSGEGADVEFDVAGETFAAHRCILAARSPVFMAELFGAMKEKTATYIRVEDVEAGVFKALLHFIYNDSLPDIEEDEMVFMAQHLLVAADRYSLDRLKLVCEKELCRCIDTSTVATTLALADQHNCHGLKESCFRFLRTRGNMTAAMATDGFEHLTRSCSPLVRELVAKVST
ncbi:hypothetical protein PR202_ga22505 [Eleusine coracana subsp. coracana]|uniref:Uncharacterized protein n=1 Tax=Eleusine coracana subsp. coracana TaxID=191504 RepID=A0AAV5D3C9_ELECO|nr:hypothetical protein PR202_ga22505 [Eleusine coracana subsp. coracana]